MVGTVTLKQGSSENAEEMFRKAFDINREILPQSVSDLTDLDQQIALSLQKQGKLSEATKIQKHILAKVLHIHGEDHIDVVKSHTLSSQLGEMHPSRGDDYENRL